MGLWLLVEYVSDYIVSLLFCKGVPRFFNSEVSLFGEPWWIKNIDQDQYS